MIRSLFVCLLAVAFVASTVHADTVIVDNKKDHDTNEWDFAIVASIVAGFAATSAGMSSQEQEARRSDRAELVQVASYDAAELLAQGNPNAQASGFLRILFDSYKTLNPSQSVQSDVQLAKSFLKAQVK